MFAERRREKESETERERERETERDRERQRETEREREDTIPERIGPTSGIFKTSLGEWTVREPMGRNT